MVETMKNFSIEIGYKKENLIAETFFWILKKKIIIYGGIMLKEKVEKILNEVRPYLQSEGGDVELVEVTEDGIVKVKLTGACGHCPMSIYTLKLGIEQRLKEKIPEVKEVVPV